MWFSHHFAGWGTIGDGFQYKIGNMPLEFVECHRELGVFIDWELKLHSHIGGVVHRVAGLANSLLQSTVNRTPEYMDALFTNHVRPILDYCSSVWNVGDIADVTLLKSVQRRWTKKIKGLSNLSYCERLRALNLFSIKSRLLRSDLIKY